MCAAGFGWRLACAACGTYAWRVAALMRACLRVAASAKAGWQKTFLLNLYRLNRHSRTKQCWARRACLREAASAKAGAALSGYLHITTNYITVRLACAKIPNFRSK